MARRSGDFVFWSFFRLSIKLPPFSFYSGLKGRRHDVAMIIARMFVTVALWFKTV